MTSCATSGGAVPRCGQPGVACPLSASTGEAARHPGGGTSAAAACWSGRCGRSQLDSTAAEFPGSQFLGADFSAAQIAAGRSVVSELSLGQHRTAARGHRTSGCFLGPVRLHPVLGGVSWVGAELQAQLLSICRENLAPHGVALVSFNAYPGWHGGPRCETCCGTTWPRLRTPVNRFPRFGHAGVRRR